MTAILTALKLTGAAIAFFDSRKRVPREGREDSGPSGSTASSSHKSGKRESRDNFELHVALFVILNVGNCLNEDSASAIAIFILPDIRYERINNRDN